MVSNQWLTKSVVLGFHSFLSAGETDIFLLLLSTEDASETCYYQVHPVGPLFGRRASDYGWLSFSSMPLS